MRKSKFTEEQIIGFLKQAEAGMAVVEICRKGGFSDATFYKWRAKFGGMEASDAKRLRELEVENGKLKSLLAEAHLDMHVAAEVILTHCAEVMLTHLGEDDGLCGAVDVDPGGSSGDTSDGTKGRGSQIHRQAAELFAQHGAALSA